MGRFFLPLFCLAYSLLFLRTLPDFGPTWDSALGEFEFGERNLAFWQSLDIQKLSFEEEGLPSANSFARSGYSLQHPEHIWSLGPTLSALSRKIFYERLKWLDDIPARHVFLLPLVLLLFWKFYRFVKDQLSEDIGALSLLVLAVYPRFWAHAHNNIKDIPSCVFIALSMMYFYEAVFQRGYRKYALFGFSWGLALAAKANALFLPVMLLVWLSLARRRPSFSGLLIALTLASAVFALASPAFVLYPERFVAQLRYIYEFGLLGGSHWKLMPVVNALSTIPVTFFITFVIGLFSLRRAQRESSLGLFLLLGIIFPILRASLPYANDFDVIRHWLEVLPFLAICIGVGVNELFLPFPRLRELTLLLIFTPVIGWNLYFHPYNLCFYNAFVGGLAGAQERHFAQSTDYWGSSYLMGLRWINKHAEKDSLLSVGVGEHIVAYLSPGKLRADIELKPFSQFEVETTKWRYLMFVTRRDSYSTNLLDVTRSGKLVWEVEVDGAPILKIFSFPPRQ